MNEIGERLRQLREAKGMGLRETARAVGISAAYLSRIEVVGEKWNPSEDVLCRLAVAFDADEDELMRLAGRVPSDLSEWMRSTPGLFARLRRMKNREAKSGR